MVFGLLAIDWFINKTNAKIAADKKRRVMGTWGKKVIVVAVVVVVEVVVVVVVVVALCATFPCPTPS